MRPAVPGWHRCLLYSLVSGRREAAQKLMHHPCPHALLRPHLTPPTHPPQVADLIKSDRLNRLNAVVNRVAEERAQRFAGRDLEVLVEGPNPRDSSQVGLERGAGQHAGVLLCKGLLHHIAAIGPHGRSEATSASCRCLLSQLSGLGGLLTAPPLPSPPCRAQAVGRTRHNKLCYFPGDGAALKGQLVHVHIDRVHAYTLYGRMLD